MNVHFCVLMTILALGFGKNINTKTNANYLSEIPKYIAITKELDAKRIPGAEAFPEHALHRVSIDEVDFIYYSQEDIEGTKVAIEDSSKITKKTKFNKNLDTVFLIHGWQNTCYSSVCSILHDFLLKNHDYNYFTVCWDSTANLEYLGAYSAVSQVGQFLGDFIKNLSTHNAYDLSRIKVVGHSLGAHIAGWAGKENNGGLSYIVGLDPAGPLFFQWDTKNRLDETDAEYVQAIHTDGVDVVGLGVGFSVGTVDFWPNGGKGQPGCGYDTLGTCAHGRSYKLFAESINDNKFFSRKCTNYKDYTMGKCKGNAIMYMGGFNVPELGAELKGNYYLETNETSPYGLGDIGL